VLSLEIEAFLVELKEGSIENVGPANKEATAKLYDVETAEAREFGDNRVKLAFADDEGNEVEVALFPEHAEAILEDVEQLRDEGTVWE